MPERTDPGQSGSLRDAVLRATHGDPPDRACLPNRSDREWETYQLGVEEAICAAEAWMTAVTGKEQVDG